MPGSDIEIEWGQLGGILAAGYVASSLASISGLGGGGILIPLYAMIAGLDIKEAIVLSIVTIAGNAFVRMLWYSFKKHKSTKKRYLPDYTIARLVVPFDGNTSWIGRLLNDVIPDIGIFIMISFLLIFLIYKTVIKAIRFYRGGNAKDSVFLVYDNIEMELPVRNDDISDRKGDSIWYIVNSYISILGSFGLLIFFTFMIKDSDIEWAIYLAQLAIVGLYGYNLVRHIRDEYKLKKKKNFNWVEGDIPWSNWKPVIQYIVAASFVGFASTLLGIGGGMIMNPVMINFHVLPDVVVATSSITSFFSSVASALQFIIIDGIFEWYFALLFIVGCLSSVTGIIILHFFRKRIRTVITFVMCGILITSLVLLMVYNIQEFIENGI